MSAFNDRDFFDPAPIAERKATVRRKHKKSKVGCPQCRKRKVKCDETLPACIKCVNRKVRCGYLDFTPREIDLVKLAHWEDDGADPSKIPIEQQFDPDKKLAVYTQLDKPQKPPSYDSSFSATSNTSGESVDSDSPLRHSSISESISEGASPIFSYTNIYLKSPLSEGSATQDTLQYRESSIEKGYEINLITHKYHPPTLDLTKYPSYFNETLSAFEGRAYVRGLIFSQFIYSSQVLPLFSSTLLFGYGPFLTKYPELLPLFLQTRGVCMQFIVHELSDINDENVIAVLRAATLLNCSSIFLKDKISYKNHFKFSTGPTSIFRKVYENPSKYPKTFNRVKLFANMSLYTTKYVWVPQYNNTVLYEFYDVVKEFGEKYIINRPNKEYEDKELRKQHDNLVDFIEFCLNLFEHERSPDLVLRYPIDKLHELVQRWYAICPSGSFTMGSKTPPIYKVFYVFWFTLLKLLESFIISCRYVFSFFLDGLFLIYPFQRAPIAIGLDSEIIWYFNYCCRIMSFFDRRMCYVMGNTLLKEPLPVFLHLKDRLRARPLDIHERCITSFKDTIIKKIHYPIDLTTWGFKSEQMNDYLTLENTTNATYGEDSTDDMTQTLFQQMQDLGTQDGHEPVDLVNGINPSTSMLEKDYDPRYTDPIFEERVVFQEADLAFFDRYIEDRKLIVHLDESE